MAQGEGGGRPTKFTPERRKAILESIAARIPYILAAQANGIGEETLYGWLRQGFADLSEGIDSEFAKFSEDLKKVEQEKIKHHLNKIDNNVERWQADAWILERRWHKLFGANAQLMELNDRLDRLEKESKNEVRANDQHKESERKGETESS